MSACHLGSSIITTASIRRWRHAQYLANVFWWRWIKEYILTLQERQKWLKQRTNFVSGDLVLIASDNVPRGQWPFGRVLEGYPDIQVLSGQPWCAQLRVICIAQ